MTSSYPNLQINEGTKIKALLQVKQDEVLRALADLNPNFKKLQNPILRKLLAGRVTIAEACRVASCPVSDFMQKMSDLGFQPADHLVPTPNEQDVGLAAFEKDEIVDFDARPVLAANADPLKQITKLASALENGQALRVSLSFVPVPLITLLAKKGFVHATESLGADHFRTYFKKVNPGAAAEDAVADTAEKKFDFDQVLATFPKEHVRYLDVRDLEMPQPMIAILEQLETLAAGEVLFVHHKKVPVYFLPQLHEKGYEYLLKNSPDGPVDMLIYRV